MPNGDLTAPGLGPIRFDPSVSPQEQDVLKKKLGAQPQQQQWQYVEAPDSTPDKPHHIQFPADWTPQQMRERMEKAFPDAYKQLAPPPSSVSKEGILADVQSRIAQRKKEGFIPPTFTQMAKQSAIPLGLQAAGALGIGAMPALAPYAIPIEAGLGASGEAINQALGITEPSKTQIGLAAAAPVVGRAIPAIGSAISRNIAPYLPGAGAALRQFGIKEAEKLAPSIRPGVASKELYEQLSEHNPLIPIQPIRSVAADIHQTGSLLREPVREVMTPAVKQVGGQELESLEKQLAYHKEHYGMLGSAQPKIRELESRVADIKARQGYAGAVNLAGGTAKAEGVNALAERLKNMPNEFMQVEGVSFKRVWATMKDLNDLIASAKGDEGAEFAKLMKLKAGMWRALEAASETTTGPTRTLLRQANLAFRQEIASDTVDDVVFKNFGKALEGTEHFSANAARARNDLVKALREDKFLAGSFPPGKVDQILETFDKIRRLPVRGAPPGADAGSKKMWMKVVGGGALGDLTGRALGVDPTITRDLGIFAGAMGQSIISKAIQTPKGSDLLLRMLNSPGGMNYPKMAALATFVRGASATPGQAFSRAKLIGDIQGPNAEMKQETKKDLTSKIQQGKSIDAMTKAGAVSASDVKAALRSEY